MEVPDLRKIGLLNCRWIVSRKRTANLFNLSTQWKKTVFRKLDEAIAEEGGVVPEISNIDVGAQLLAAHRSHAMQYVSELIVPDEEIVLHRRDYSLEMEHPEFGRLSKNDHLN